MIGMREPLTNFIGPVAIGLFATRVKVTRLDDPGVYQNGRFIDDPSPVAFTITASVQAVTGDDLQRVSEGRRTSEALKLYTTTKLQTADAPKNIQPDKIEYLGEIYQVEEVEDWSVSGDYYKIMAIKVGQ